MSNHDTHRLSKEERKAMLDRIVRIYGEDDLNEVTIHMLWIRFKIYGISRDVISKALNDAGFDLKFRRMRGIEKHNMSLVSGQSPDKRLLKRNKET